MIHSDTENFNISYTDSYSKLETNEDFEVKFVQGEEWFYTIDVDFRGGTSRFRILDNQDGSIKVLFLQGDYYVRDLVMDHLKRASAPSLNVSISYDAVVDPYVLFDEIGCDVVHKSVPVSKGMFIYKLFLRDETATIYVAPTYFSFSCKLTSELYQRLRYVCERFKLTPKKHTKIK